MEHELIVRIQIMHFDFLVQKFAEGFEGGILFETGCWIGQATILVVSAVQLFCRM